VAAEMHKVNLPVVTKNALSDLSLKKGDPRLKAIAVTVGPGQEKGLNAGIKFAQVSTTPFLHEQLTPLKNEPIPKLTCL
jgi:tRNA A37 threonylcarbamoyltransferase TsaD